MIALAMEPDWKAISKEVDRILAKGTSSHVDRENLRGEVLLKTHKRKPLDPMRYALSLARKAVLRPEGDKRPRHDRTKLPANWRQLPDGSLWPIRAERAAHMPEEDRDLLETMARVIENRLLPEPTIPATAPRGEFVDTTNLPPGQPVGLTDDERVAIRAALAALGPSVDRTWQAMLVHVLTLEAWARENARVAGNTAYQPGGARALSRLRSWTKGAIPAELTLARVNDAIAVSNLSGAGGRGKLGGCTPRQWVARFERALAKARRGQRRNSKH